MANWVYVEDNTIVEYRDLPPHVWKNISGLDLSKDNLVFLKSLGWFPVTKEVVDIDSETQQINSYTYTIREDDVLETGVVTEKPITSAEDAKNQFCDVLRIERNKRLASCDWTQLIDVQASFDQETKQKWAVYRQALRDLPEVCLSNNFFSFSDLDWPTV